MHVESGKHKHNMEFLTDCKAREDPNKASHISANQLGRKLYEAFVTTDIPLRKLDIPELQAFLEEHNCQHAQKQALYKKVHLSHL